MNIDNLSTGLVSVSGQYIALTTMRHPHADTSAQIEEFISDLSSVHETAFHGALDPLQGAILINAAGHAMGADTSVSLPWIETTDDLVAFALSNCRGLYVYEESNAGDCRHLTGLEITLLLSTVEIQSSSSVEYWLRNAGSWINVR